MDTILTTHIQAKSAWLGQDLAKQQDWIYQLNQHELNVLDQALLLVEQQHLNAPYFSKADVPIADGEFLARIAAISEELENGYGFIVIRGLNAEHYREDQLANLYYILSLYLGDPVTQNARGDLIGYVENIGDLNNKMTRVYETNAYLPYHADLSDVVGLLSLRKAKHGGLSSLVSSASVYNYILTHYPHYLAYYYHPAWYDHLGEVEPSLSPIFSYFDGKLACRYLRYYIELGHQRKNVPLSRVQQDALNIFDQVSQIPELRLDMMLEPGDMQFCNNYCVMHSRSAFEDFEELAKRRKLLRVWLKMANARQLAADFPGRNGIPQGLGQVA